MFERSRMFFEQRLLFSQNNINKNEKKINKEVGVLLPKKELIQMEYIGRVIIFIRI